MADVKTLQAVIAVALVGLGLVAVLVGDLLLAGVAFLAVSLTIYMRERSE